MATSEDDMRPLRFSLLRLEARLVLNALAEYARAVRAERDAATSAVRQMDLEGVLRTLDEVADKLASRFAKVEGD